MAELSLSTAALGILAFTSQLLLLRLAKQPYLLPLLTALLAMMVILSGPLVFQSWPGLTFMYIAALPIAFFALPPSLYLYAQALTARQQWRLQWRHSRWYWTQLIAIPLAMLIYTLPGAEQQALFFEDADELQGQTLLTAITFLLATLLWLGLSLFYLIRITLTLRHYRQQLRQVFAADAGKRLVWLDGLLLALLLTWVYAVMVLLSEEHISSVWLSDVGVLLLVLVLVWLLCYCGLQQRPGFAELSLTTAAANLTDNVVTEAEPADTTKYQRSALSDEQSQRIAKKAQQAVYHEALYLDSALTLYKLADHIDVSAQYLSQTLNQTLQQSFYDYINQARIAAAKQLLQQTDDSVLTIATAVGFNARSSFYKAFKAATGLTPVQYRAQHTG